jgi:hypothetical protein
MLPHVYVARTHYIGWIFFLGAPVSHPESADRQTFADQKNISFICFFLNIARRIFHAFISWRPILGLDVVHYHATTRVFFVRAKRRNTHDICTDLSPPAHSSRHSILQNSPDGAGDTAWCA